MYFRCPSMILVGFEVRMVPYSYNMVDMGGIDLAEANGTEVPGIYEKITEAMNLCGDVILYNWEFAGISIAPSAYSILQQSNSILINGLIQVTELDQITVIGLPPPPVPVLSLEVTENGEYEAEPPISGFNPVTVNVVSGEYIQYRVHDGNSTLFEEYYRVGSQIVIHQYLYGGNNFYELDVNEVAATSVDISVYDLPLAQTNYSIVQAYSVDSISVRGYDIVVVVSSGVSAAGIVFSGSAPATVVYKNYSYRQCGGCTSVATLPTIQNSGAGRLYFRTPQNDVETVLPYNTVGQNFFASGQADNPAREIIIKNFIEGE